MGDTFSLDTSEFASQAPAFVSAGDQLSTALAQLQSVLTTNADCWGNDDPGKQFVQTYQPDADTTTKNIQTLAATLKDTGSAVKKIADNTTNQDQTSRLDLGNTGSGNLDPNGYSPYETSPSDMYSPSDNGTSTTDPGTTGVESTPATQSSAWPQSPASTPSSIGGSGSPGSFTPNQQGTQANPDQQPSSQHPADTQNDPDQADRQRTTTPSTDPTTSADDAAAAADAAASMLGGGFGSDWNSQEPDPPSTGPAATTAGSAESDATQRSPMFPGLPQLGNKKDDRKKKPKAAKGSGKPSDVEGPEPADQPPPVEHSLSAAEIRRGAGRRQQAVATPWSSRVTATPAPAPKEPDRG